MYLTSPYPPRHYLINNPNSKIMEMNEKLVWDIIDIQIRAREQNIDLSHLVYMPHVPEVSEYPKHFIIWEVNGMRVAFLVSSPNE